jgi:hypothetical protein
MRETDQFIRDRVNALKGNLSGIIYLIWISAPDRSGLSGTTPTFYTAACNGQTVRDRVTVSTEG